ncbi:8028_t:CDS:2, partial [Gigaspora margarita]
YKQLTRINRSGKTGSASDVPLLLAIYNCDLMISISPLLRIMSIGDKK